MNCTIDKHLQEQDSQDLQMNMADSKIYHKMTINKSQLEQTVNENEDGYTLSRKVGTLVKAIHRLLTQQSQNIKVQKKVDDDQPGTLTLSQMFDNWKAGKIQWRKSGSVTFSEEGEYKHLAIN